MLLLVRWLSHRSLVFLHILGTALGWLTWALSPSYRRRGHDNARLAGVPPRQSRAAVAHAGRMVGELPWLWLSTQARPISRWAQWGDGVELIDAALARGRGLLLLTPHLGAFEVCAQAYAERYGATQPMTALYRPARQPWLREFEAEARHRPGLVTAPATLAGVRQMIRALRRGETIGLLPDQVPPEGLGVWAPFFGRPAYTMTLATRLVQQTGCEWLLMWTERLGGGRGYRVHVCAPSAPLPASADDDVALQLACASALNHEMEQMILRCPEQYLWGYHRYKRPRPELGS
ncbi:MAG TPA: lysophospholipid acyltransferase family protein [Ideonella sp.]|jgi:KDO2-lipid IV(A) lauroyltransferase|nr:lysophospholipid acyltransferase family protein [Ideonella sp.]